MAVGLDNLNINNLKVDIEVFLQNKYLEEQFKRTVDSQAVIEKYRANDNGLFFKVNSRFVLIDGEKVYRDKTLEGLENRYVMLEGSLHTYSNDGLHNYNDFTPQQGIDVIRELEDRFKIDLERTVLNGVEFGLNIRIPFDCRLIFDNLICYKGLPFTPDKDGGDIFYSCVTKQFRIKIYDKGKQYKLPYNLLRFELKVTTMQYLRKKGTFHSLLANRRLSMRRKTEGDQLDQHPARTEVEDRKSTRLNSSHVSQSRMPSSA